MSLQNLSEINPHLALWQSENWVSPVERDWERFVRKVEAILGHGLDGDDQTDGYSIDTAHDFFAEGETPEAYALEAMANEMELEAAFGPMLVHPGAVMSDHIRYLVATAFFGIIILAMLTFGSPVGALAAAVLGAFCLGAAIYA